MVNFTVFSSNPPEIDITYQWYLKDSTTVLSTQAGLLLTDSVTKTFVVAMTYPCGINYDTITVMRDSSLKCIGLGVNTVQSAKLKVQSLYTINQQLQLPEGNWQVELYNTIGQKIFTSNLYQHEYTFTEKGLYLYRVYDTVHKRLYTGKLVVE